MTVSVHGDSAACLSFTNHDALREFREIPTLSRLGLIMSETLSLDLLCPGYARVMQRSVQSMIQLFSFTPFSFDMI